MSVFMPNRDSGLGSFLLNMLKYEDRPVGVPIYQVFYIHYLLPYKHFHRLSK